MKKKATLVAVESNRVVWALEKPWTVERYHAYSDTSEFVDVTHVVTSVGMDRDGVEIAVFACDENGVILDWDYLHRRRLDPNARPEDVRISDHRVALAWAGIDGVHPHYVTVEFTVDALSSEAAVQAVEEMVGLGMFAVSKSMWANQTVQMVGVAEVMS
jgi:hypothetical protein